MEILPKQPTAKGPDDMFTGDVWFDLLVQNDEPSRLRVGRVRFAPGARSAWHSHAVGQTLHVVEGTALVRSRGGDIVELQPGDTSVTPPGEWHWHGATPDHFMVHLTIWEAPGDDGVPETDWGDHVTDEQYDSRSAIDGR
jgi:quercetin dioxygenase-like cupin family protein